MDLKKIIILCLTLFTFFQSKNAVAQGSNEKYGQNQIQYQNFSWKYYDSTHFRIFFYRPAEKLAEHVLDEAENEVSSIVQKMGGSLPRKLNIILYNSYTDYLQSNIGIDHASDLNDADGGRLKVSGDNLPIYFTGNHIDLIDQVKHGVANVIKDKLLFGGNIKDVVKNAIKMNLPEWYSMGYVEYISNKWTPELETDVKNIISATDSNFKYHRLAQTNPKLIGHSFWHFIEEKYGPNTLSALLYLSRFKKNVDEAISQATGQEAQDIYTEWRDFYNIDANTLNDENTFGRVIKTKLKTAFEGKYSQFHLSPNGTQLAYVVKKDGEWKIVLQETDLRDENVLAEGGFKNLDEVNDPNYPLISWSPSGKKLVTIFTIKDKTLIRIFTTNNTGKQNKLLSRRKIERITGVCFSNDDNTLIFSGIKKGQSDLFSYNFRRNQLTNLTNDAYDDYAPSYVSSGNKIGILFLSNRTDTVMNQAELAARKYFNKDFNIFYFNQKNRATLRKVTEKAGEISSPIQYGLEKFSYIENIDGMLVRKIIKVDAADGGAVQFQTDHTSTLPFNVLKHHYLPKQESLVEVIKKKGEYYVYNTKVKNLEQYDLENLDASTHKVIIDSKVTEKKAAAEYISDFGSLDTTSSLYSALTGRYPDQEKLEGRLVNVKQKRKKQKYKTTFNPKSVSTSLDNTLLFTRYQNIAYNPNGYQFPDLNGFMSFELIDILEDHKITGGIRVPPTLDGLSYFLQYANYKKRLDWKVTYFHQSSSQEYSASDAPDSLFTPTNFLGKVSTEYIESSFSYPFNRANSLRLFVGFRLDQIRYPALNSFTINFPNDREYWSFMRLEYVFDNTINPYPNIRKGTRAKVFGEYQYRINKAATGFYQVGFDARNYLTIYKNTILASRIASGLSDGSAKLLYYLGGVDNPISLNNEAGPAPNDLSDYAFQTYATNLRGYKAQALNGSSYAVINEEVRLPIYNTFFKRPLKSSFLRNLQLVGFIDVGVAWRGLLPLERNISPVFTRNSANVIATFTNEQKVMGIGYGTGIRTKLMGYFMRLDVGWNIEKEERGPRLHLSMATDF